jgi:hypothetical protein
MIKYPGEAVICVTGMNCVTSKGSHCRSAISNPPGEL